MVEGEMGFRQGLPFSLNGFCFCASLEELGFLQQGFGGLGVDDNILFEKTDAFLAVGFSFWEILPSQKDFAQK